MFSDLLQDQLNLTDDQQRIVAGLTELCEPIVNEENPGCCPFTFLGLRRMCSRDPGLYLAMADYHGWPTDFTHPVGADGNGMVYCHGATRFRSQEDLRRHVDAKARRAPAFHTPTRSPYPVESDDLDGSDQDVDSDDEESRNLQAHVVLQHVLRDGAASSVTIAL